MIDALDQHPERGEETCVVFLQGETDRRSGLQLHGYDDDTEAIVHLLMRLRAIFRVNGQDLLIGQLARG
jgi:hypothetical protein